MPGWVVSEPNVNLLLNDTPLWYRPTRGRDVRFQLSYKNTQGSNGVVDASQYLIFGVGTNWNTPWRSYLVSYAPDETFGNADHLLFLGEGGVSHVMLDAVDYETSTILSTGDDTDTYYLTFNDGARYTYGPRIVLAGDTANTLWLLSRMEDPNHNALNFQYLVTNNTVRLSKVVDVDNRETTFTYTNSGYYSNLITSVAGPYGLSVQLAYDGQGRLTNITDVIQMSSALQYDGSNNLSRLITPYGTSSFDYYSGSGWRGLRVTELGSRKQFYLQGDGPTNLFSNGASEGYSLSNYLYSAGFPSTCEVLNLNQHNSYYWGPRQYDNLSSTVRSHLDSTNFAIADLTTNDFNKGRTRHWLVKSGAVKWPGSALALERQPSPQTDGAVQGTMIWYDHEGKIGGDLSLEGYSRFPRITARRVSDADWEVRYAERFWNDRVKLATENYGPPGAVAWRSTTYQFAANHIDLTKVIESGVTTVTNEYNGTHQITTSYNALDEVTTFTYDDFQRLSTVTKPNGLVTAYTYDTTNGSLTAVVEQSAGQNFRTNSYTYTNGLVLTHTDPRGLIVTNAYDALGRLIRRSYFDGFVTNVYDKLDLVRVQDRMGFASRFEYDGFRQLIRSIDANSNTNAYQYCDCGSLNSMTDPLGNTNSFTYDNAGRRTRVTHPGSSFLDSTYDIANRLISTTDNVGVAITNGYTIHGLLFTASNAVGRVFYKEFDEHDRVRTSVDQNGVAHGFSYDDLGRLIVRTNRAVPDFGAFEFRAWEDRYNYTNNVPGPVEVFREFVFANMNESGTLFFPEFYPIGERVVYSYDLFDRKTNEVHCDINGVALLTNGFAYSPASDLTALVDGKRQTTTWKYDRYGRVTNKLDATSAQLFRYIYDADGRLTNRWSPGQGGSGITTAYAYDSAGNLTFVGYPASSNIVLQYDGLNRVTNMLDGVGTTRYTYTAFGALQSEDGPWDNDTVSYSYTANRLRAGIGLQQANASAWTLSYGYDLARRLTNVTSAAGAFAYQYQGGLLSGVASAAALVKQLTLPNGAAITNDFDPQARLLGTWLRDSGGSQLNLHAYTYDDLDRRTRQTRVDSSSVDYGYDALGQLQSAMGKESGGSTNRWHEQLGYAYDVAGNLNYRTNNVMVQTFSVNSLNQLTTVSASGTLTVAGTTISSATNVTVAANGGSAVAAIRYADATFARTNVTLVNGTNTFTAMGQDSLGRSDSNTVVAYLPTSVTLAYDSNGNLRTNGTRLYDYDDENQLISTWVIGASSNSFAYDGKLRLRISRDYEWRNGGWVLTNEVRRVYDHNLVIQERNEFNIPVKTYTRGKDMSGKRAGAGGVGGLLAMTQQAASGWQHLYYHADGNGNVAALLGATQNVVARYLYDPFGNTLSAIGPMADVNLYRFSSKEWLPASGLVYYLYRIYDPNVQRWLNRDPIEERGGRNLYRFAINRPSDVVDKFGLLVAPPLVVPPLVVAFVVGEIGVCIIEGTSCIFWPEPSPDPLPLPPKRPKPKAECPPPPVPAKPDPDKITCKLQSSSADDPESDLECYYKCTGPDGFEDYITTGPNGDGGCDSEIVYPNN
jgi:RHS repeat-associated protein